MRARQSIKCREDWEHVGYSKRYGKTTRLSCMERKKSKEVKTQTINIQRASYKGCDILNQDNWQAVLHCYSTLQQLIRQLQSNCRLKGETNPEQSANIVTQEIDNRYKTLDVRDLDGDVDSEIEATLPTAEASPSHCPPCPFKKIMELFHSICVSYPRIVDIDGERKKAVAARWRKYQDISKFEEVFRIAESSSFMKGENQRNYRVYQYDLRYCER